MDRCLDRSGGPSRLTQDLQLFANEEELHDTWRYSHSTERDYTFYSNPNRTHSRIDFFLVDKMVLPRVSASSIGQITWSDHAPIELSIETAYNITGRPTWHLNPYTLKNSENLSFISSQLSEFFEFTSPSTTSPSTLWCAHKAYVRGLLIQLTAKQKRIREQKLTKLIEDPRVVDVAFKTAPSPQHE